MRYCYCYTNNYWNLNTYAQAKPVRISYFANQKVPVHGVNFVEVQLPDGRILRTKRSQDGLLPLQKRLPFYDKEEENLVETIMLSPQDFPYTIKVGFASMHRIKWPEPWAWWRNKPPIPVTIHSPYVQGPNGTKFLEAIQITNEKTEGEGGKRGIDINDFIALIK